jgi:hypothetical protein
MTYGWLSLGFVQEARELGEFRPHSACALLWFRRDASCFTRTTLILSGFSAFQNLLILCHFLRNGFQLKRLKPLDEVVGRSVPTRATFLPVD